MPEISAGYFPDYDVQWDIQISRRYKTLIFESVSGIEQRRKLYPAPATDGTGKKGGYGRITATSSAFTLTQRKVVADFLDSMEGSFKAFYLFRRDYDNFSNYYVGDVIAQSNIIIPFKDVTVSSVTVNDVSKTFTVTANVGTGGESRINFTGGNQTGAVRINCLGRERWLVRAENDDVIESFVANVVNTSTIFRLAFKQVR